ncbi:MAG TPA: cupredoxin domain-containing protein [Clostridia bacterium]|nr:cupredoxin domain-containing protein [Clostridia bacterium]
MRPIRPAALLLVAAAALLLAACSSEEPGWTYAPEPSATPVPSGVPSGEPSGAPGSPAPSGQPSGAPTGGPGEGDVIQISAEAVQFDQDTLTVPADAPFQIEFANNDAGIQHNVEIKDASGQSLYRGEIFPGVETRTYDDIPPLPAGTYQFICTVHPNMIIEVTAE